MITFVLVIWLTLNTTEQIIVVSCLVVIGIAIGLFIHGQTRKVLFMIPDLLHKKHKLAEDIAKSLSPSWSTETMGNNLLELVGINLDELIQLATKTNDEINLNDAIEQAKTQVKNIKGDNTGLILSEYLGQQSGFDEALLHNTDFQKIDKKLESWKGKVPTEAISVAINNYERKSYVCNSAIPMLSNVPHALPLRHVLDSNVNSKNRKDEMDKLFAKVRESIANYYATRR